MKVERLKWFLAVLLFGVAAAAGAGNAVEEAVMLDTPTGKLAGSLLVPASAGKMPVALIIAGSGPTDRDGNNPLIPGKNDSLKMLAQVLAEAGVASLRYDKRGIAASAAAGGKESDMRFDMYVDDAAAWIGKLKADPRFGQVIILGHSEGSFIGMLAAQRTKPAAYVSLAGIAEPAGVVLRKQFAGKLPPDLAEANERILSALEHGKTADDVPPALAAAYRPSVQPYLISWFKYVPAKTIGALDMPVLIVQGDNDVQVGVEQAQALKAAQPRAALAIIPGMNHVLKIAPTDPQQNVAAYGNPALPLAPQLVAALNGFLHTAHLTAN
jgi:alpha-beta hydrolase superfamily lysophospholipase